MVVIQHLRPSSGQYTVFIFIQSSDGDDDGKKRQKKTENRNGDKKALYDMLGIQWIYSVSRPTQGQWDLV